MNFSLSLFRFLHGLMAALSACTALMLIVIAARMGGQAFAAALDGGAAQRLVAAVGLFAAAVVARRIAEAITEEEEVIRDAGIGAPTRVRRFLSRFFVVVIVALAIEGLVAIFEALHEDPSRLSFASTPVVAAGVLLAAWGCFARANGAAEELEPEARADAKCGDRKVTA